MEEDLNVAINCNSLGQRCGIYTYSKRLKDAFEKKGVKCKLFANKIRMQEGEEEPNFILVQYEPGMCTPQHIQSLANKYVDKPLVLTCHHSLNTNQLFHIVDGIIYHDKTQIVGEPWDHVIVPHPALIFPEKGKEDMRKKYGIPLDKKVLGTAGFIHGTGKQIDKVAKIIFKSLKDDEFVYFLTSLWKGGDDGNTKKINEIAKKYGKENNYKIDTEFVPDEIINEKMQCCDLLFAWNDSTQPGSNSGVAMDMIGARRKTIVKNVPHYNTPANIDKVEVGRPDMEEFIEDTFKVLREGDLDDVPDPEPYSWDVLIEDMIAYLEEFL